MLVRICVTISTLLIVDYFHDYVHDKFCCCHLCVIHENSDLLKHHITVPKHSETQYLENCLTQQPHQFPDIFSAILTIHNVPQ